MKKKLLLFMALLLAAALPSRAQVDLTDYEFSTGVASNEWIVIDGTDVVTITSSSGTFNHYVNGNVTTDAGATCLFPIDFNFKFDGVTYTQFSMNTHGILRLGAKASTNGDSHPLGYSSGYLPGDNYNTIVGLGYYGTLGTSDCYLKFQKQSVATGNVLVCEYRVLTDDNVLLHYQIQLYENTNEIHIVYGTPPATIPSAFYFQAGLAKSNADRLAVEGHYNTHWLSTNSTNNSSIRPENFPETYRYFVFKPYLRSVSNLQVTNITPTGATVTWTPNSDATRWQITNSTNELSDPSSAPYIADVTNGPTSTSRYLSPNTRYHYYVRAVTYDATNRRYTDSSHWQHITFVTPNNTYPYHCDFSNPTENSLWELGSNSNGYWSIVDGSLYASCSTYNENYASCSARRMISLAAGTQYCFSFDWQCGGVGSLTAPHTSLRLYLQPLNANSSNDWIPLSSQLTEYHSDMEHYEVIYDHSASVEETFLLVALWSKPSELSLGWAYLDNIFINPLNPVSDLAVSQVTTSTAHVSWSSSASQWQYVYSPVELTDFEGQVISRTSSPSVDLNSLEDNSTYYFYVRPAHNGNFNGDWESITFRTPLQPPYLCDFSNATQNSRWKLYNGEQTNRWVTGSDVEDHTDGALYITDGNGYHYNIHSTSYVYAAHMFTFEEGTYDISFDWRCFGDLQAYDILRAFLVPANVQLEAGNAYGMSSNNNTPPQDWIALTGLLYQNVSWQHFETTIALAPGTYQLVYFWKNDAIGGAEQYQQLHLLRLRRPHHRLRARGAV